MGDGTPGVDDKSQSGSPYTVGNVTFPSCDEIKTYRNNIGLRFLVNQPPPEPKYAGGYEYTPERESRENGSYKDKAAAFLGWAGSAQPSQNIRNQFPEWKLKLIDKAWSKGVGSEGAICSVNAWDFENLFTWGRGFASAGALQDIVFKQINENQAIKDSMTHAGISVQIINNKKTFVLVDDRDCQQSDNLKTGEAAIRILRKDQRLISLFVNIGQGELLYKDNPNTSVDTAMRQKVMDVQWLKFALLQNYPEWTQTWEDDARNLASHNIHYGGKKFLQYNPAWDLFRPSNGTLKDTVRLIGKVWGTGQPNNTTILDADQTKNRLLLRANGVAKKVLELHTTTLDQYDSLMDGGLYFIAPLTDKEKKEHVFKYYTLKN